MGRLLNMSKEKIMELTEAVRVGDPVAATLWVLINRLGKTCQGEVQRREIMKEILEWLR